MTLLLLLAGSTGKTKVVSCGPGTFRKGQVCVAEPQACPEPEPCPHCAGDEAVECGFQGTS